MNKHEHKHEHCKHNEVKYCQHCDVVYCRECGHEWNDRPKGYWYPSVFVPTVWTDTGTSKTIASVATSCGSTDSWVSMPNYELTDANRFLTVHNHD